MDFEIGDFMFTSILTTYKNKQRDNDMDMSAFSHMQYSDTYISKCTNQSKLIIPFDS